MALTHLPPHAARGAGRRVGASTLAALGARLTSLLRMDLLLGADLLRTRMEEEFTLITTIIAEASYDEHTRTQLHTLAAGAAGLAGWTAHDCGDPVAAAAMYQAGSRLAGAVGADDMGALCTAMLAYMLCATERPSDALDLLNAAAGDVRRGRISGRTAAAVCCFSANAHASLGDGRACARSIEAAHTALDRRDTPGMFTLNSWMTSGFLELETGLSLFRLGRPDQALSHLATFNSDMGASKHHRRTAAIGLFVMAEAHLQLGEVEAAVSHANQARAFKVSSAQASLRAGRVHRALTAHSETPCVRDYLECVPSPH
ncbi:hypothetical protein ACFWXK_39240 [Streptomyces sp. NPDC059070]|uniref:hypothetical protein n=1 Tax=Streptomyces sp. NPDC059070 TaxID=3346713 RepID=UPI0036C4FD9B